MTVASILYEYGIQKISHTFLFPYINFFIIVLLPYFASIFFKTFDPVWPLPITCSESLQRILPAASGCHALGKKSKTRMCVNAPNIFTQYAGSRPIVQMVLILSTASKLVYTRPRQKSAFCHRFIDSCPP